MVQNLTEGRPLKLLFFFALPMVAGNLFQQLYNMVDTMVVGKFVGEDAVAAVGSSFPIVFLSVAVASGLWWPRGCPWAATWWSPSSSGRGASMR